MKIHTLGKTCRVYTARAYLVLGAWNRIPDVNTLIDCGTDGSIADEIAQINTGVGKKPVDQVILTHNHFDHSGGLEIIRERYHPTVYAFSPGDGVDKLLKDGQVIRIADRDFAVIHVPTHSNDSVCLYCAQDGVLFSGDTPLVVRSPGGTYNADFVGFLEYLLRIRLDHVYPGHDVPMTEGVHDRLRQTLENVRASAVS